MSPIYYELPILILVISLVYSATRFDEWGAILRDTVCWSLRMAGFLVAIGVALYAVAVFAGR
jgi:integral membrane sensor domain MASE1